VDYRPLASTVPALPVAGAHADMQRIAALIEQGGSGLSDITVTLDSHQRVDIAHPTFWCQGDGSAVAPFTQIRAADVGEGRYRPRAAEALPRVQAYLEALEANGRYLHMVWPVHCEIGSWGHNVHDDVRRAYNRWEEARVAIVTKVLKGSNPWTEHYSALKAEVPLADDPATQLNMALVDRLRQADRVLIAGEAGSHCVKATTEHIVENFAAADLGKLVLLTDCMSPVAGFEAQYAGFLADMQRRGVQLATSAEVLPELLANGASR
ncbi:MAG TPA: cysteine hydrolase, partial [Azonexus sp.]|nr:cysteine hydrolase [Azonexus sp.]